MWNLLVLHFAVFPFLLYPPTAKRCAKKSVFSLSLTGKRQSNLL